jgi:hypothetical protein
MKSEDIPYSLSTTKVHVNIGIVLVNKTTLAYPVSETLFFQFCGISDDGKSPKTK